jgi:hypothetical protein
MQELEIVEHAIKKAQGQGWNEFRSQYARAFKQHGYVMVEFLVSLGEPPLIVALESVLFSSSFAEHIFGTDTYYFVTFRDHSPNGDGSMAGWKNEKEIGQSKEILWEYYDDIPAYEYHLQQLAVIDSQSERIAYLGKHL